MLEDPVTNNFVHKDIFNDMSIHWFPFSKLQQASLKTWQDTPEPVYDCEELEIILASWNVEHVHSFLIKLIF